MNSSILSEDTSITPLLDFILLSLSYWINIFFLICPVKNPIYFETLVCIEFATPQGFINCFYIPDLKFSIPAYLLNG